MREVKRTRTRVERQLRQRRNQATRLVKRNRRDAERQVKAVRRDVERQVGGVQKNADKLAKSVQEQVFDHLLVASFPPAGRRDRVRGKTADLISTSAVCSISPPSVDGVPFGGPRLPFWPLRLGSRVVDNVAARMDREELARRAAEVRWFHKMDLGQGVITEGQYDPQERLGNLHLPRDLGGMEVLDVGAWDGFYSFEAERRGASRVLATDSFSWNGNGWGSRAGFELAHTAFSSNVEAREVDVLDLDDSIGRFDVVFFLGVLYHMRHPLLALERVASVTRGLLVLETHLDLVGVPTPAVAFYPGAECNGDPTNGADPTSRPSRRC